MNKGSMALVFLAAFSTIDWYPSAVVSLEWDLEALSCSGFGYSWQGDLRKQWQFLFTALAFIL